MDFEQLKRELVIALEQTASNQRDFNIKEFDFVEYEPLPNEQPEPIPNTFKRGLQVTAKHIGPRDFEKILDIVYGNKWWIQVDSTFMEPYGTMVIVRIFPKKAA